MVKRRCSGKLHIGNPLDKLSLEGNQSNVPSDLQVLKARAQTIEMIDCVDTTKLPYGDKSGWKAGHL